MWASSYRQRGWPDGIYPPPFVLKILSPLKISPPQRTHFMPRLLLHPLEYSIITIPLSCRASQAMDSAPTSHWGICEKWGRLNCVDRLVIINGSHHFIPRGDRFQLLFQYVRTIAMSDQYFLLVHIRANAAQTDQVRDRCLQFRVL